VFRIDQLEYPLEIHSDLHNRLEIGVTNMSRRKPSTASSSSKMRLVLRINDQAAAMMARARARTFKLTLIIVISFITCWSPYVWITLW